VAIGVILSVIGCEPYSSRLHEASFVVQRCEARPAKGRPPEPVASLATVAATRPAKRRHASVWAVGVAASKTMSSRMPCTRGRPPRGSCSCGRRRHAPLNAHARDRSAAPGGLAQRQRYEAGGGPPPAPPRSPHPAPLRASSPAPLRTSPSVRRAASRRRARPRDAKRASLDRSAARGWRCFPCRRRRGGSQGPSGSGRQGPTSEAAQREEVWGSRRRALPPQREERVGHGARGEAAWRRW